ERRALAERAVQHACGDAEGPMERGAEFVGVEDFLGRDLVRGLVAAHCILAVGDLLRLRLVHLRRDLVHQPRRRCACCRADEDVVEWFSHAGLQCKTLSCGKTRDLWAVASRWNREIPRLRAG